MEPETKTTDDASTDSLNGCLVRLFWMLLGNVVVLFCAVAIYRNSTGHVSAADAYYWVAIGCLVGARYVDVRYYGGTTAGGEPATLADWRSYMFRIVVVAAAGWLVIHAARLFSSTV